MYDNFLSRNNSPRLRDNNVTHPQHSSPKKRLLFADDEFNLGLISIQGKKSGKIFRG